MARSRHYLDSSSHKKYIPGSEARPEEIFSFPYFLDDESVDFISAHGRIMFIVRGPPGTGKNTLSSMISTKYPSAVTCSADSYFSRAFVSKFRNPENLKTSHEFCHSRVKEECEKGTHPLIVQNTHMKKWEMQDYIKYAAEYDYTVIMAITLRKFEVSPVILARTNKKGLTQDYFRRRLRQWEEVIPQYTGWFLCPDDSTFLLQQAKISLESLLEDKEFCKVFSKDKLMDHYEIKSKLFCIATYCNSRNYGTYREYYCSDKVQDVYGKCFPVTIQGYVVTKSLVLAVVAVTEDMKSLMLKSNDTSCLKYQSDDLSSVLGALNVQDNLESSVRSGNRNTFMKKIDSTGKTAELTDWNDDEVIDIKYVSLIVLAEAGCNVPRIESVHEYVLNLFSDIINSEGSVENSQFSDLDNEMQVSKLCDDAWLIKPDKKVKMNTIFTGFYV